MATTYVETGVYRPSDNSVMCGAVLAIDLVVRSAENPA